VQLLAVLVVWVFVFFLVVVMCRFVNINQVIGREGWVQRLAATIVFEMARSVLCEALNPTHRFCTELSEELC